MDTENGMNLTISDPVNRSTTKAFHARTYTDSVQPTFRLYRKRKISCYLLALPISLVYTRSINIFLECSRFLEIILENGWWTSLSELSRPAWRPNLDRVLATASGMEIGGKEPMPTRATLEGFGAGFVAETVRWWQIRGKKPARLLTQWMRNRDNLVKETDFIRDGQLDPQADEMLPIRRLIDLAVEQQSPIWVDCDLTDSKMPAEKTSPSYRPRILVWLVASRNQRAVIEVELDMDRNRISGKDRELYLRAMRELRDELSRQWSATSPVSLDRSGRFIHQLPSKTQAHPRASQSAEKSIATLVELASILDTTRSETIRRIELQLASLEGSRLDSLLANQWLAKSIHQLLDSHGFRVSCPECGEPAIMRCLAVGNSTSGSFVFDHYLAGGRTFHGGRGAVPKLVVVPKPARQTSKVG